MSTFTTPLVYENFANGSLLRIAEPFEYHVGGEGSLERIRVPSGFVCDGQSYPRLLWCIDSPQGQGAKAGVVHDFLYWLNERPVPIVPELRPQLGTLGTSYDRAASDFIYREACEVSEISHFRAMVRFKALRWFGGIAWNGHTREIASGIDKLNPGLWEKINQ